jgi:hypothetical protein
MGVCSGTVQIPPRVTFHPDSNPDTVDTSFPLTLKWQGAADYYYVYAHINTLPRSGFVDTFVTTPSVTFSAERIDSATWVQAEVWPISGPVGFPGDTPNLHGDLPGFMYVYSHYGRDSVLVLTEHYPPWPVGP